MVKSYSFTEVSITEKELEKIIKNHEPQVASNVLPYAEIEINTYILWQ